MSLINKEIGNFTVQAYDMENSEKYLKKTF